MSFIDSGYLPPVVIDILGRDSDLISTIAQAKTALRDLEGEQPKVLLGADGRPLERAVAEAEAELTALDGMVARPTISPQVDNSYLDLLASARTTAGASAIASALGLAFAGAAGGGDKGKGPGLLGGLGWGAGMFGMAGVGSLLGLMGLGAEHGIATGLGVAGSAAGGLLGGGLLGLGALGVGAVGMGTDMAGVGQAVGDLSKYSQAYDNLQKAIAVYGANSTQAQHAQNALNYTLAGFPAAAQPAIVALHDTTTQFHDMFNQATGNAEMFGAQILQQAVQVGQKFLPIIGEFATENTQIIQNGLQPLFSWLTQGGPNGGMGIFYDLEQQFQKQLPTAIHAVVQGFELFVKTVDTASHYTGGFIGKIDEFLTKWNGADFGRWQTEIGRLIGLFRTWEQFIIAIGRTIYDIFKPAVGTGQELIQVLTGLLGQVDKWLTSASMAGSLHSLFGAHRQEIDQIGKLIQAMLPALEGAVKAFVTLSTIGAGLAVTLLKPITAFVDVIARNPVADTLIGWAGTLLLIGNRLGPLLKMGDGLGGALGKGLGLAGYGAVGGAAASQALGLHGDAATAMTAGGAAVGMLPALPGIASAAAKEFGRLKEAVGGVISMFAPAGQAVAGFVSQYAAQIGRAIAAGAMWIAAHAVQVAVFVAQNLAMAASATAAFIAENAATLGLVAAAMVVIAGIVWVATHWKQTWADIKHWFDDAVNFLRSGFGTLVVLITGPFAPLLLLALHWQQVWSGIKDAASTVWDFLRDNVFSPLQAIFQTAVIGPLQTLGTIWAFIWGGIQAIVQGVWNILKPIFDAIGTAIHDIVGGVSSIASLPGKIGGGIAHDLNPVNWFAGGTSFAPGGLAMVGERGPELVKLPHGTQVFNNADTRRMLSNNGRSQTIHNEIHVHGDVKDPYQFSNELGWRIRTLAPAGY